MLKMATGVDQSVKAKISAKRKWESVSLNDEEIFSFKEEGLISLEELTDYQMEDYQQSHFAPSSGKKRKKSQQGVKAWQESTKMTKAKKHMLHDKRNKKQDITAGHDIRSENSSLESSLKSKRSHTNLVKFADKNVAGKSVDEQHVPTDKVIFKCDMSDWKGLGVPDSILAAMSEKGFTKPTPIQAASLPYSIFQHQDIIGAAETGSGKTLAFVLPILSHIMDYKNREVDKTDLGEKGKAVYALILSPTRELALQIFKNIQDLTKYTPVYCASVVGGLSVQKQERLLRKTPDIIVGTPGRLLSTINEGAICLEKIRFLVIDEVDRMLEFGHFKDAIEILRLLALKKSKWQTFLFSATLTVPQYHRKWSGKRKVETGLESVQQLVDKAKVSNKAKIIDLTKENIAAEQIKHHRVICTEDEKDVYLFYVILSNPGRTLIFVNSISCTKKITNFLTVLQKSPLQLHAGKQQRQRLKALDRFIANDNAVMVATDVAARGLDIPNVDTVIHYHLPKDPKIYIHRSGRTARANSVGCSIILEGPKDFREYKKICMLMKLPFDFPSLETDYWILPDIKRRVMLARKIEKEEHQQKKKLNEKHWFYKAAKSLDLEEDIILDASDVQRQKNQSKKLLLLKRELNQLLQKPLVPKGFSGSYITKSGTLEALKV